VGESPPGDYTVSIVLEGIGYFVDGVAEFGPV